MYNKTMSLLIGAAMVFGMTTPALADNVAGSYSGTAKGFAGNVTITVTIGEDGSLAEAEIDASRETHPDLENVVTQLTEQLQTAGSADIDGVSGATFTSTAVKEAAAAAFAAASGEDGTEAEAGPLAYTAGTYTGSGTGMNGAIVLDVTFSEDAIEKIEINSEHETGHVGTPAYDIMFADAIAANGSGIDMVSGATFTSRGIVEALNDAAEQASVTDLAAFKSNTIVHEAQEPIEKTVDVVVVGAGGAGISAAAQAAMNGDTVLVLEKNAEVGGNTLVSGGQFQSVDAYLAWDPEDPEATTGEYEGVSYEKVHAAGGDLKVLKTILEWSEEPFDASYFDDHEFVAGEIDALSKAGVHEEYLPTLQELKKEIQAYVDWADAKIAEGKAETDLPMFSTINLHIFQTYYGGLRPNADKSSWIYGEYDLVRQFIVDGQELKEWLVSQGSTFDNSIQPTIVGALWQRENQYIGADLDGDGESEIAGPDGRWGAYFASPMKTLLETSDTAADNEIMLRTTADSLIIEDGKVTGVKASMYDGTEVTAIANKGVILATGGFAADIARVIETNDYWQEGNISNSTQTTNRSSQVGDGIDMGVAAGADTTGMEFTQLMPISWIDNGQLAFGGGNYAIYVSPVTGERYLNETGERDVLSIGEFANGVTYKGANGTVIEIANSGQSIPGPYPYGTAKDEDLTLWESDVQDRQYTRTVDELDELFKEFGFECTGEEVKKTIEEYDKALMSGAADELAVPKTGWTALIGQAEQDENGNYLPDTYTLDGVKLKVRLLAPSTHHTMGGLKVDAERHVLNEDGEAIEGLYAAGEVTGGIHGGNRLGGNAIVEIFVSGRTAANAVHADAE